MRQLSIDFGTSNTVVALAVPGQAPRTLTFDASPLLPSAVFAEEDGSITVGREAQRKARLDPTRYEPNPKRRIDDGDVLLGDRVVGVVDLIAAVLRTVATEVRRQLGGAAPDEVRLTHPAQWGATRQNTLVSAARAAGLGGNLVLIPEPVAAAAQYTRIPGRELPPGGSVAVYDLGGGTFDVAVVGRTQQQFHVLAEAGLGDLGGLDFDQAVLEHVARTASSADPGRWQQIMRPADASSRRAARALADDVRAAKETLSRYPQTDVALPDPFEDVHLTRAEFEGLIRPDLLRSIEVLRTTLRSAGTAAETLTGIFLVGGSSRIPLVASLISEQIGIVPVALDQPETAVALGALLVPVQRESERTHAVGAPVGTPASGPLPTPGWTGPQQLGPRTPPPSGPVTGPRPGMPTGQPVVPARRSRRGGYLAAAAVAVVVVAVAVVLIVAKPWARDEAGPGAPGTSGATSAPGTGTPRSGATTAPPPTTGDPSATGFGPQKVLTQAEYAFLGGASDRLENCGDNTRSFLRLNPPEAFQVPRVVRCEIPEDDANGLYGRNLLFVFDTSSPEAAQGLLSQIEKDRRKDEQYTVQTRSGTAQTSAGSVRTVIADHLELFGKDSQGEGVPAVAWAVDDSPLVAVMTSVNQSGASDLLDYYELNYKPR